MGARISSSSPLPLPADLRALPERTARVFMMRVHLAICRGCRNVSVQFRSLRVAVKSLARDGDEEKPA